MRNELDLVGVALADTPRTYATFITNKLYLWSEDLHTLITIPSNWIMHLVISNLKPEDGEVEFGLMPATREGSLHICYSQAGGEWISIADTTVSTVKQQAAWLLLLE